MRDKRIKPGSVVQINGQFNVKGGKSGWVGCLAIVDEVREWGVLADVPIILNRDRSTVCPIRLTWEEMSYIGEAVIKPII